MSILPAPSLPESVNCGLVLKVVMIFTPSELYFPPELRSFQDPGGILGEERVVGQGMVLLSCLTGLQLAHSLSPLSLLYNMIVQ